jgi:uncharacterized protein involved in exopolysaccharide biosynthesis
MKLLVLKLLRNKFKKQEKEKSIMEEISLREMIEILLKGKWIIAIVTAICIAISAFASFIIMPSMYEAQTVLMISPVVNNNFQDKNSNNISELVGTLSKYPQMTIDTYREQLKTPVMLDYIRNEMGWQDKTITEIGAMINVSVIKNTNLIAINLRDTKPDQAAKAVNLLSSRFTAFISETNKNQAESSASFITYQSSKEKESMDKALAVLKDFISQPRSPQELKLELESKLKQLTEFKTDVIKTKVEEQSILSSLEQGKKVLSNTPKTIITKKSLINNELLNNVVKEKTGANVTDVAGISLNDEIVNETYIELSKKVNELELNLSELTAKRQSLESEIVVRQKEVDTLQAEFAGKQQKLDILTQEVDLSKQTYDAYQQKYKEEMIKQSADIGKSSIVVISPAVEPKKPVAPKKVQNIVIGVVLGLVVGAFVVFIKEYWNQGSLTAKEVSR